MMKWTLSKNKFLNKMIKGQISNRFFRNQERLIDNFMRDFENQLESMESSMNKGWFNRPIRSFFFDDFFRQRKTQESEEERQIQESWE